MPDRQDIDALMIGALYGELDAAESARLEAHLSSHPEDRAELASLERTRTTLRQGLAEVPSAEPPQAISAVLLQEAARRAPARKAAALEPAGPGLWSRFVTWLRPMAGNPAFAGALALVLVGGAVTTLWLRGGTKAAVPTMSESRGAGAAPQA
ncbi:MAG: hypothetical protein KC464_32595, partial [Myxococcales bacterium]|nr:hypothetical protein [Myxococcales bacterium]